MFITYDPPKRAATLKARNLDLAMVTEAFFATAKVVPGKKGRFIAVGRIDGRPYAVVYKPLGTEAVSIVTMRVASRKERRLL